MPLKNARQYYVGRESSVSPLWQRIGSTFQAQFLVHAGDREYDESRIYVRERKPDGGVVEADLEEYLDGPRKRLLIVTAPAGLGKTTFVRHTLTAYFARPTFAVVWLDLLRDLLLPDPEHIEASVANLISAGLERALDSGPTTSSRWIRYFLAHRADPTGLAHVLLEELDTTGTLRPASRDSLQHLLRSSESAIVDVIRLKFRYLRTEMKRMPVLVIDNVDQLSARALEAITRLAFALAEGPSDVGRPDVAEASAKVIMAMRPLSHAVAQRAVGTALQGELKPPDIAQVILRRIERFLAEYDKKILPGATLPLPRGGSIRVSELIDTPDDAVPETVARHLLRRLAEILVSDQTPYGDVGHLVLKLNNYNTRVTLLATAHYVASGHIDWTGLFRAVQHDRSLRSFLTWPKVLRAMFLGVRATFRSDNSWLYNLFNDGEPDRTGAVIRPRLLKLLGADKDGLSTEAVNAVLGRLFGYPHRRIQRNWADALDRGLIHEPAAEQFLLTDAGWTYLKSITKEFEYLQHVVIDAWVDSDHLVRCTQSDESAADRYERVLLFADWIRQTEVQDYAHVLRNDAEAIYDRYFGEDTLSGALCDSLLDTERMGRAIVPAELTPLQERTRLLREQSSFASIRAAALSLGRAAVG